MDSGLLSNVGIGPTWPDVIDLSFHHGEVLSKCSLPKQWLFDVPVRLRPAARG
ncbi:MAG: hypothetical protein ACOX7H_00090 [Bacillota bacterium]